MKKPLSFILVMIGAFFAWQWFLSRRDPKIYAYEKEQEIKQRAAAAANNATMRQIPASAKFDPRMLADIWDPNPIRTPQERAENDERAFAPDPYKVLNPLLFGLFNRN